MNMCNPPNYRSSHAPSGCKLQTVGNHFGALFLMCQQRAVHLYAAVARQGVEEIARVVKRLCNLLRYVHVTQGECIKE